MFGIFGWIRTRIREAFIKGIEDGMCVLDGQGQQPQLDLPEQIRERLLPAASLPSDGVEENGNGVKKRAKAS